MPFQNPERFTVRRLDAVRWRLQGRLVYAGKRQTFIVPSGYVTDFASVPWWVQSFIPRTGVWTLACVLHDWLLTHGIPSGMVSSRDADGLFRRVLREEGTGFFRRWLMWAGVRCAAPFNAARRPSGVWRDLPALLAIGAPVLALVGWLVWRILT